MDVQVSIPLAAAGVVWCGTLSMALGPALMDLLGITLPAARGAAMGVSSHSAGTLSLSIAQEDQATAVSGAMFPLAGVFSVALCSFPPFLNLLFAFAGM